MEPKDFHVVKNLESREWVRGSKFNNRVGENKKSLIFTNSYGL